MKLLVLGASYGSLFATKCLMAGHDATLVCRAETADLINAAGTEVRLKLRDEDTHRTFHSHMLPGTLDAAPPDVVSLDNTDVVVLAMQEPQYAVPAIRTLLGQIAEAGLPCLSLMNMPPLAYLKRIAAIEAGTVTGAYGDPDVWDAFAPGSVTLCSPDPQAFRPPDEKPNVLHVGLPTNFKAAPFADPGATQLLTALAADIEAVRHEGKEVPVKLRVHESLFVPLAKWSMLLTGNYRCVTADSVQAIRDAVHGNLKASREIYEHVADLVVRLGGDPADMVPFEKYAAAAEGLTKPSSVARAIASGATNIERVDRLVALLAESQGVPHPAIAATVETIDAALEANRKKP